MAGTLGQRDYKAMQELLILDYLRGEDSVGIAGVSRSAGHDVETFKATYSPIEFIQHPRFGKVCTNGMQVLMGHNRKMTVGKITPFNAHPFEIGNVVGAHNGTISKWGLEKAFGYKNEVAETDSETIINAINEFGPDLVLRELDIGAFALTWYDKRDNTINLARNLQRPLVWGYNEKKDCIYWASEAWMLRAALGRNQIKLDADQLWWLEPNAHTRWVVPGYNQAFAPEEERAIVYAPPPKWSSTTNYSGVGRRNAGVSTNAYASQQTPPEATVTAHKEDCDCADCAVPFTDGVQRTIERAVSPEELKKPSEGNVVNLHAKGSEVMHPRANPFPPNQYIGPKGKSQLYRGFDGQHLTQSKFEKLVSGGCDWCSSGIAWGSRPEFIDKEGHVLCEHCADDETTRAEVEEVYPIQSSRK